MKSILMAASIMFCSVVIDQPFIVGDRVDVYASDGKYYAATIMEAVNNQLKVRYLGLGSEQDAIVNEDNVVRGGAKGDRTIVVAPSGTFQGIVKEVSVNSYKVKYDGYPEIYPRRYCRWHN